MGTNGSVRPALLGTSDAALDIMAVRYLLVQANDVAAPSTMHRDGVTWTEDELGIPVGRPDCAHLYPRSMSIPLPADIEVAGLALVTHLRCDEDVEQDAEVLRVRLVADDGVAGEQVLKAGVDTAETGLNDESIRKRAHHRIAAAVFDDPSAAPALRFMTRITFPRPTKAQRLEFQAPAMNGWVTLDRITVIDAAGKPHPLASPNMWLAGRSRWKVVDHYETSRISDRGSDAPDTEEFPYTVVENLRALPRAWVVSEVKALSDGDALEAVHRSQLPDGATFDPRTMALVDVEQGGRDRTFPTGEATARVERITDSHFRLSVSTAGGGFLVLSETHYPGWHAYIDGAPRPVERTNVAFQGVEVPAGSHIVEFRLESTTHRVGVGMSIAGVLTCALLLIVDRRRTASATPADAA